MPLAVCTCLIPPTAVYTQGLIASSRAPVRTSNQEHDLQEISILERFLSAFVCSQPDVSVWITEKWKIYYAQWVSFMGNMLRLVSENESPEECSVWCHSSEADCTAFNFNAGRCELLSEANEETEASGWRSGRGKWSNNYCYRLLVLLLLLTNNATAISSAAAVAATTTTLRESDTLHWGILYFRAIVLLKE